MYTIRPDKPVNPVLLEILSTIQTVTGELDCDYLLVGATDPRKRDRLLVHMTRSAGIESGIADRFLSQFELGLRS